MQHQQIPFASTHSQAVLPNPGALVLERVERSPDSFGYMWLQIIEQLVRSGVACLAPRTVATAAAFKIYPGKG